MIAGSFLHRRRLVEVVLSACVCVCKCVPIFSYQYGRGDHMGQSALLGRLCEAGPPSRGRGVWLEAAWGGGEGLRPALLRRQRPSLFFWTEVFLAGSVFFYLIYTRLTVTCSLKCFAAIFSLALVLHGERRRKKIYLRSMVIE